MQLKRTLNWDLIIKYTTFLIAIVITSIAFISLVFTLTLNSYSSYPKASSITEQLVKKIKYYDKQKKLELPYSIDKSAWAEVLLDNKVVFTIGSKLDSKMEYTQEDMAYIANSISGFVKTDNLIYEYIPFAGQNGERYTLLIKKPKNVLSSGQIGLNLPYLLKGSSFEKLVITKFKILMLSFLFTLLCILLLFGKYTSKTIIEPLKKLNAGLQNVMNCDYTARVDYKGSYEFESIVNAFNCMTSRLETAEKENKKLAESKKRLLLDISHDLRTPATTIQGYAEALATGRVQNEEDVKKYLNYIYIKSKSITDLIETLFKYSKLESSVYEMNKKVDDLSEFLRNMVIKFYGELSEKEFELDISIPEERILFNFDSIELERALSNIISNIIRYNSKNTLFTVALEEKSNSIELHIGDNGIGIPEHLQKDIFNALVRGDNSRKADGGMGLGLAIAKKIIMLHDGEITLESESGKGSHFYISFQKQKSMA